MESPSHVSSVCVCMIPSFCTVNLVEGSIGIQNWSSISNSLIIKDSKIRKKSMAWQVHKFMQVINIIRVQN